MKKFLILFSIISIFLSLSLINNCDKGMFCCEDQHSSASQCSTCSFHVETVYDTHSLLTKISLIPTFLGQIFFSPINNDSIKVVITFDRPPTLSLS